MNPFWFAAGTALLRLPAWSEFGICAAAQRAAVLFRGGAGASLRARAVRGRLRRSADEGRAGRSRGAVYVLRYGSATRLFWVSVIFGRDGLYQVRARSGRSRSSSEAQPSRWGFFRLGPLLGLLFSAGLAVPGRMGLIACDECRGDRLEARVELPEKPSISQVSELFFQLKQAFDDFIVTLLSLGARQRSGRGSWACSSASTCRSGFVASVHAAPSSRQRCAPQSGISHNDRAYGSARVVQPAPATKGMNSSPRRVPGVKSRICSRLDVHRRCSSHRVTNGPLTS